MFDDAVPRFEWDYEVWLFIISFFQIFGFKVLLLRQYQLSEKVKIITDLMGNIKAVPQLLTKNKYLL